MLEQFLTLIHLSSLAMVVMSLGALCWHVHRGGTRQFPERRWLMLVHGVSLLIVLLTGLGLKYQVGIVDWPVWLLIKIGVWVCLGAIAQLIFKFNRQSLLFWWIIWSLTTLGLGLGLLH
jgi:hypothetical protein